LSDTSKERTVDQAIVNFLIIFAAPMIGMLVAMIVMGEF